MSTRPEPEQTRPGLGPREVPVALGSASRGFATTGSNLKGKASGAGWLYALPRLGYRQAVLVGAPSRASLAGVSVACGHVLVVAPRRSVSRTRTAAQDAGAANVTVIEAGGLGFWAAVEADLVVRAGGGNGAWATRVLQQVSEHLSSDVVLVGPAGWRMPGTAPDEDRVPTGTTRLRVTPATGEMHALVPAHDRGMQDIVRSLSMEGSSMRRAKLARVERRIRRRLRLPARHLVLSARDADPESPPAYVMAAARAAGVDLSGWRWAVVARGEYDSQKVLLLLTSGGAAVPTMVVKVTRSLVHADRLDTEARALRTLADRGILVGQRPTAHFEGRHGGKALLAESSLDGVELLDRTTWRADCPYFRNALATLNELARSTRVDVPAGHVADALTGLVDRFAEVYRASADELARLRAAISDLRVSAETLPLVFQHGDPHVGNMLVSPAGVVQLLDWEAADPGGLPLWDLLYFTGPSPSPAKRDGACVIGLGGPPCTCWTPPMSATPSRRRLANRRTI